MDVYPTDLCGLFWLRDLCVARACACVCVLGRSGGLLAPLGFVGRFGDLRLRWRRSVPGPDHGLAGSLLGAAICWQSAGVFSRVVLVLPRRHWGEMCQLCVKCANFVTSALDPLKANVCSLHCSMMALKVDRHRFVLMRFRRDRIGVV